MNLLMQLAMVAMMVSLLLPTVGCKDNSIKTESIESGSFSTTTTTTTTTIPALNEDELLQVQAIIQMLEQDTSFRENTPIKIIYLDKRTRANMIGGIISEDLPREGLSKGIYEKLRHELEVNVMPASSLDDVCDYKGNIVGHGIYVTVTAVAERAGHKYLGTTIYRNSADSVYITYQVKQITPDIILLPVSLAES